MFCFSSCCDRNLQSVLTGKAVLLNCANLFLQLNDEKVINTEHDNNKVQAVEAWPRFHGRPRVKAGGLFFYHRTGTLFFLHAAIGCTFIKGAERRGGGRCVLGQKHAQQHSTSTCRTLRPLHVSGGSTLAHLHLSAFLLFTFFSFGSK